MDLAVVFVVDIATVESGVASVKSCSIGAMASRFASFIYVSGL